MEFQSKNKLNTTTMIDAGVGTSTAKYLFDGDTSIRYISAGNSTTSSTISISFTSATILSHILIQNHNLKSFSVYYDNTTTNSLFSTTTNSATNSYISFASVTVSSIQFSLVSTVQSGVEKKIGELALLEKQLDLDRLPSIKDFKYAIKRKQINHEMPDGGYATYNIKENYEAKLTWRYITSSFKDSLLDVFTDSVPFYFVQKPTTTSWNGLAWEVNWVGAFDFKPSTNVEPNGFTGTINLKQNSRVK